MSQPPSRFPWPMSKFSEGSSLINDDTDSLLGRAQFEEENHTGQDENMDWCCLTQLLTTGKEASTHEIDEKQNGLPATTIDLLSDEGSERQNDLWRILLQEKLDGARLSPNPFSHELSNDDTFDTALQALTAHYTKHGFTNRLPVVNSILMALQPFTAVISTMVQSNPGVAALVWGSVQLVLLNVVRYVSIFEDTGRMLLELAKDLPRFQRYSDILHTPRLHYALRDVYSVFIDFSFTVTKLLRSNMCYTMIKIQWTSLGRQFEEAKAMLLTARAEFESETNLANVEIQAQRHVEIMAKIPGTGDPVTTVLTARNVMFTGRDDVLTTLHAKLVPSFAAKDPAQRTRCSCSIHAIGGMGKTETTLEYIYRFRSSYSHIFWLRAETSATLSESFMAVFEKLELDGKGLDVQRKIKLGLDWLQSSIDPWLLVFDNAEDPSVVREFWPAGVRGAIIITTQNADFTNFTQDEIMLEPMQPEEGRALIQRYLGRGGSEKAAADALSRDLGGLPLAIAHFAGYVAKSQCTIEQIRDSYRQRYKSSQIWDVPLAASTSKYDHTLATVWDLAWRRLSSDAVKLLDLIAFLNPDSIPEDMFIGDAKEESSAQEWKYWDTHRFNEAVRVLRERHLVDRDNTPTGTRLRTHRSLQRSILQRLDKDPTKRQEIFDEAVSIVRKAFPEQSIAKRGDPTTFPLSEKYLPHVISLNTNFKQSQPKIGNTLIFAELLHDGGFYSFQNSVQIDGYNILETGMEVSEALFQQDPTAVRPVLANILGVFQIYCQYLGVEGRNRAVKLAAWALQLREEDLAKAPASQWTSSDFIQVARASADRGITLSQFNNVIEARQHFDRTLECYKRAGNEESLPARFGLAYFNQGLVAATEHNIDKTRDMAHRSIELISQAVGFDNDLTLFAKFMAAICLFTIGDIAEALELHKEVYDNYLRVLGASNQATLASQYNLAVAYQNSENLETAEKHLRQNLENGYVTMQWRDEDVARTKFRLALVLRAQSRPGEASLLRTQALEMRQSRAAEESEKSKESKEYTDRDDMELFDIAVTLLHGRTTDIWTNGEKW